MITNFVILAIGFGLAELFSKFINRTDLKILCGLTFTFLGFILFDYFM